MRKCWYSTLSTWYWYLVHNSMTLDPTAATTFLRGSMSQSFRVTNVTRKFPSVTSIYPPKGPVATTQGEAIHIEMLFSDNIYQVYIATKKMAVAA